jgi:tetratricopeptide (TPR) repeat protein
LLAFVVYLPVSRNDFVNYDDPGYITSNAHVQNGLTLDGIGWAFRSGHASNWHPVTWLSHMLDVELFGLRPGPTHLVNVALHTANAVLLFLLFAGLTGLSWRSWFVAAFFALHPLHVESVAWAAERKDVLSTLFFLVTVALYVRYARAAIARTRWVLYSLTLVSYALGLMSKPMLVTLPFVLLLLDYWPLKRFPAGGAAQRAPSFRRLLLEKVPFFCLSLCASVVTFLVQKESGAVGTQYGIELRVANAVVAYAIYLLKTLWPLDLAVLYPHPGNWPLASMLSSGLVLAAVSVGVLLRAKTKPYLLVGWLWFLGTLVPVIGLVQVGVQSMADRYTYIPLIGIFFAGVWWLTELTGNTRRAARSLAVFAGAVGLLLCAGFTVRQLSHWQNSETLFQHALAVTRNNFVAYNSLGFHYGAQGRGEEELEYYRKSLEANPDYAEALNNMGCALGARGRFSEALPFLERALRQRPRDPEVHFNIGNALWELGQRELAVRHYQQTLQLEPRHAEASDKLGMAAVFAGRHEAAILHFQTAINSRPDFAPAYGHLGNVYALQQRWMEAAGQHRESVRLQPGNATYRYNLANVLLKSGRPAEAVPHLREAVKLAPQDPDAAYKLGLALLGQGDRQGAVNCFEQALRLKPGYAEAQKQLQSLQQP